MTALRRRRLLQALGLGTASLFLPSRARAQTAPPKRLIVMFTQHGFVYDSWKMRPPGVSEAADFDVDLGSVDDGLFSPVLRPLTGFKDKLTVIDGLSMATAEADVLWNEHDKGVRHALTAKNIVGDEGRAGGASLDQLVARQVGVAGRIDSLEFGVIGASAGGCVFRGPNQPLPPDVDPRGAFARLFPAASGDALTDADKVRLGQASVLDLVAQQYTELLPKLSREDAAKLALHRDLVRGAEARVRALQDIVCARPGEPVLDDDFGNVGHYESRFDAFVDITAAALACDLTRVVTIQMSQLRNDHVGIAGDVHADYAHTSDVDAAAIDVMTRYGAIHGEHFRRLLAALESVPEGNGTLLDNCAVLWCSELATGTHKFNIWPAVVAGGAGGALRTGRYLRFVPSTPNANPNPDFSGVERVIGRPHNQLLTSLGRAVGADLDGVGETELVTTEGQRIDCRGPIDELMSG